MSQFKHQLVCLTSLYNCQCCYSLQLYSLICVLMHLHCTLNKVEGSTSISNRYIAPFYKIQQQFVIPKCKIRLSDPQQLILIFIFIYYNQIKNHKLQLQYNNLIGRCPPISYKGLTTGHHFQNNIFREKSTWPGGLSYPNNRYEI